ncbi:MAG: leucine-rich repeat domain-containing protein [Candidatus Marinimicrobia bacterium]|nr:leucine-rich repeat domain-containing protein [Candidatus Neomarinimicrobiota bacterium]
MKYPIISILLSLTIIIPQEQIKYGLPEVHEQNLFSRTDPPANLIATGGDGEITLTWDTVSPDLSRTDVTLWISNVTENNIEISMLNTEDVYGFQFNILADSLLGAVFGEAFGGRSEEAGFSISTNPEGLVIGFSFANDFITPGDGVLTHVNWTHTGSDEFINLSFIMIGGQNGIPLSYENGVPFCFGDCIEPAVITYSIYRDGDILSAGLDITEYIDTGLDYSETHCYVVTSVDGIDESEPSNEACATTDTEPTNTDSLALVALYNSTNGDNWTQNEGWLMDTPFCEWYGITCENGFVTQINFGGWDNNLIGEIPAELGNLMNLTELLLQFNQLAGTIPIEFGNLSNLTTLSLNSNQLTGTIPVELGNLSNLTDLSLNNNQLTGTIPVELENLSNLTDLHLHSNHLTSTIPFELGNLSNLTDLSLGGNQLTGTIPVELGNLFNLTHLSLGSNQLTGTIPVELGNLSNLTYLFIQINHLTGTIPVELGNLSNLIYLYLDSNQLTGTIPVELGNLSNLTVLWLQYNQLTGSIPLELGNLSNLTSLYLFTNQLTGEIPVELGNLTNLTRLALYSNQLTGEIPESLCNLSLNWSNSSYFNITNNQLCPPYPECMADYVGDQDVTNCGELLPAPANLIAEGGDGQITLTWDAVTTDSTRSDVTLWVSDVTNGHIEISMSNTINVYGFQFNIFLDPYFLAFYFDTYGGSAEYAGFEVSSDLFGMINGNLLTDFIPPGEGVLTNIQWFPLGNDTWVDLNVEIILGQFNLPLSYEIGEPYCYGNCDSVNMTYNVYCDGNILVEDIPPTNYTDLNLGLSETHCYTVTATDGVNESDHSNEACATTLDNLTGCTDPWALNYNPEATDDDGSCEYEEISLILDSQYTNVIQFLYFIQNDNSIQEVLSPEYFPDGMPTEIIGNGVAGNYMDGIGWVGSLTELQMNTNYFIDGWGDETISYTYPGAQLLGCTDPVAINYFPNATDDDGNCRYIGPPLNLTASAIENDIYLDWDAFVLDSSLVDVVIWISDVTEEHIEISMLNNVPLYGFQFSIVPDPEITAEFGTVYGGSAQDAGFSLSSNPIGLTLGFSFTGNSIPPGECVLVFVDWTPTGTDAWVDLLVTNFSGPNGTQLTYAAGEPFCYGNCDPLTISYTIFRDDEIFADSLFTTTFIDSGLGFSETHCYTVTAFDGTNTSDYSNEACATTFSLPGCTDPLAVNYNPQATEDDETCTYVETPLNFEVLRYGGSYCLYWDPYSIDSSLVDVVIWISDITEDHIEISLRNNVPLYGFQFATVLDSTITADYGYTYGGRAQEAGFYMATSDFGMTLGFSYSGSYIEPGEGVLLYIDWVPEGIDEYIDLIVTNFSGPMGDALTFETGDPFCFGNCQPVIITYNVYRNDELLISDLLDTEYIDSDPYQNCYYVSAYDGIYESLHTTENCPLGFPSQDPQHYIDLPEPTGEFHLVHIDDAVGLEFGDEIGLFDYNGIINSGDCSNQFGEILVGASVWSGIPSGVLSAGSIDYCGSFGVPVPGYVVGNPIYIRVWNSVQNVEREIIVTLTAGNGVWGEPQTSVIIEAIGQTALTLTLEPFMNNLISINVEPDDPSIQTVFEDNVIIASNDQGEFYVPSLNYNTIGNMDILEGYKLFTSLNEPYTFSLTGVPVEPYQTINLDPFMNNLISYLPQVPMSTFDAFGAYNNQILLVSNDQGEFYIPSYGATTLTYLYPGKGYRIFLNTDSVVEFAFPQTELIRDFGNDIAEIESYKVESVSQQYDIMKTGLSTPIVITSVVGEVVPGDELVVYAHGIVVGAARIVDPSKPILLTAWEGFHSFGVDIPGYETGDEVDIRLWKMDTNREVKVIADLDNSQFGQSPMNTGILIITSTDVVPQSWSLNRAYPNPFNPVTTIGYSIPVDGYVSIIVYNVTGRQMTQLISENTPVVAGHYSIEFHGDDLPSGLYFVVMRGKSGSEEFTARQKVVLLK